MSTTAAKELITALRERREIIADRGWYERDAAGHLAALQRVSEEIVQGAARLPRPLPGQLAHYLERCSYDKALAFLEGGERAVPPEVDGHVE